MSPYDSLAKLIRGFSVSFGVFQNYYTKLPQFKGNTYVPIVGTMASGIPYPGGPVMAVLVWRYQRYRLCMIWIGWPLCILGLVAGSFAKSFGPLLFTQGIMYGGEFRSRSGDMRPCSKMNASRFRHLLLPHHKYSQRVVDNKTRDGLWNHH